MPAKKKSKGFYIRNGRFYVDFDCGGERVYGAIEATNAREAARIVDEMRTKKKAEQLAKKAALTDPSKHPTQMPFAEALTRYWEEVGKHHSNSDNTERDLAWLRAFFGETTMLQQITSNEVARAVAKRRGERIPNRVTERLVSPTTVNRTMTQPLRAILLRAGEVWGVETAKIDWSRHLLDEPDERVVEYGPDQLDEIFDGLDNGYEYVVAFLLLTGCRRNETVNLRWADIKWPRDGAPGQITFKNGKGGKTRSIPFEDGDQVHTVLLAVRGHDFQHVFTYEAIRNKRMADGGVRISGMRYPLTENGLKTVWRRLKERLGFDERLHDLRHTLATALLRKTGNLKLVQKVLGHAKIETTTKYAHVFDHDIVAGMNAAHAGLKRVVGPAAAKFPTESPTDLGERAAND